MSTFCGGSGSIPNLTDSEMNRPFPNSILPSQLPTTDMNGLTSEDWLQRYVQQLERENVIPVPTDWKKLNESPFDSPGNKDPLSQYTDAEKKLLTKIRDEYCYYESRYFVSLNNFLMAVTNSTITDSANPADVQTKLEQTRQFNKRLILFTQIVNAISKYRYSQTKEFQERINSLNDSLRERKRQLLVQYEILGKQSVATDLHSRMTSFGEEKNRANSHLLAVYGVLNITALAILIYLAQS